MLGKVLITGGFGNLGSKISLHFIALGYEVYILSRTKKEFVQNAKCTVVECDITNLNDLKKKLDFNFDYCVHTASFNEFFLENYPQKALEINTLGTRNLLEVVKNKDLKNFIYFSTFHVYGLDAGVITEDTEVNPKNDYASTHLFAEYYVKQFGFTNNLKYTILRLTNSYGVPTFIDSDKWYLVLNDLSKSAFCEKSIVLKTNGKVKRDFIYMGDVAIVVDKLLKIDATNDIYNLSSNRSYTILEMANIVRNVYQEKYNKTITIHINENDTKFYADISVKNDKLKSVIDFNVEDKIFSEVAKIFELLKDNCE
jgi:UDP-glucose 4-epimerase